MEKAETTLRVLNMPPETRAALGMAGRDWVLQRFTLEAEVQAYLKLYAELNGDTDCTAPISS